MNQEKGVTTMDVIIAMLVLSLFTGLVASISYNLYSKSSFIKRNSQATGYIVDLFEYIDIQNYSDIDTNMLISYITEKDDPAISAATTTSGLTTQYKMGITIEKYNEGTSDPDVLMTVTATVRYKLGRKTHTVTMSKVKEREIADL